MASSERYNSGGGEERIYHKLVCSCEHARPGRELIASRTGRDFEHVINHPAANSSVRQWFRHRNQK